MIKEHSLPKPAYDFSDLIDVQTIVKAAASKHLGKLYANTTANFKADGSIVTQADLAMQHSLSCALGKQFPDALMLGEELEHAEQIKVIESGGDYWCLDPLDGTTNYHATLPLYSVSLALVSDGEVKLALIYDPVREESFSAIKNQGFWLNAERYQRRAQPETLAESIALIDFKRLPNQLRLNLVQQSPYKSYRNIGSSALEWAWLAAGRSQLIVHGGQHQWDYAAGVLINAEAGGFSETIEREPIFNNALVPRSVLAASNQPLFKQWSKWIQNAL